MVHIPTRYTGIYPICLKYARAIIQTSTFQRASIRRLRIKCHLNNKLLMRTAWEQKILLCLSQKINREREVRGAFSGCMNRSRKTTAASVTPRFPFQRVSLSVNWKGLISHELSLFAVAAALNLISLFCLEILHQFFWFDGQARVRSDISCRQSVHLEHISCPQMNWIVLIL